METLEVNVFKLTDFNRTNSKKKTVKFDRSNIKKKTNYTVNLLIKKRSTYINKLIIKPKSKLNITIYILNYIIIFFYINMYIFTISYYNTYTNIGKFILFTEIITEIVFIIDYILSIIKNNIKNKQWKLSKELKKYYSYNKIHMIIDLVNLIPISLIFIILEVNYVYFNISVFLRYSKIYFFFGKEKFKMIKNILFKKYFIDPLIIKIYFLVIILWIYIIFFISLRIFIVKFNPHNNWILNDFHLYDMKNLFIISSYWVFQTIFTVGYGDILNYNKSEMLVSILWMFSGVYMYSLLISYFLSIKNRNLLKNSIKLNYFIDLSKFSYSYSLDKSKINEIKSIINKNEL